MIARASPSAICLARSLSGLSCRGAAFRIFLLRAECYCYDAWNFRRKQAPGRGGGNVPSVVARWVIGLIAVPDLLFALLIVTVLGNGMGNALLAVAIAFTPGLARVTRSAVLSLRSRDYVLAAVARGESRAWIILREVLPNALAPVVIEATIRVAFAVMIGATLGFLGLGAQPPRPNGA